MAPAEEHCLAPRRCGGFSRLSDGLGRGSVLLSLVIAVPLSVSEGRAQETNLQDTRTGPARRVIEEILVTAQKREESVQDVPISMSVVDSEFIVRQGITDFTDLGTYIPNFKTEEIANGFRPYIRGFTTDSNQLGFEQAVGLVLDDVHYGRADFFQAGLFDIDQIEVLRGPQGYLFGKNATVGLVNVATKEPTDEYTGSVNGQFGELGRRRVEAGIGGPVLPGFLNFRIAGFYEERDGHIDNTTAAIEDVREELFARSRNAVRVKAQLPDVAGASLGVSYERAHFEILGNSAAEIIEMPEGTRDFVRQFDPNTDFERGNFVSSIGFPGRQKKVTDVIVGSASYDLGGWGIDAVGGFSRLDGKLSLDGGGIPVPLFNVPSNDLVETQTTLELRTSSPTLPGFFGLDFGGVSLGSTDFIGGFFFQRRVMDPTRFQVDVYVRNVVSLILINQQQGFGPVLGQFPEVAEDYQETHRLDFEQTSNTFAGFGQMNWHFAEDWTLLYGMRLNYETKEALWDVVNSGPNGSPSLLISFTNGPDFIDRRKMSLFNFAPRVGLRYDWTDDVGFYATWSRSFRGAGFNTANAQNGLNTREFDQESITAWELGTKTRLLGGAASWNLGLFNMTLKDFQFFTFDPGSTLPQTFVDNAGELRARGIESDVTYFPTDWLSLRGSLGFNDSQFVDFPNGSCALDRPNTDGDDDPRCDLSGGPLESSPKWEMTFTPSVDYSLGSVPLLRELPFLNDLTFATGLTVQYVDTQLMDQSLDPRTRQDSFFRLRGTFGFANESQGWSLGIVGENLTDEVVAANVAVVTQCAGCFTQLVESPRQVYGQFRWAF